MADGDFGRWLEDNRLQGYLVGLEDEGYDDLEVLTLLSNQELNKLAKRLNMKPGHQIKLTAAVERATAAVQRATKARKQAEDAEDERATKARDSARKQAEDAEEETFELAKIEKQKRLAKARGEAEPVLTKAPLASANHSPQHSEQPRSVADSVVLPTGKQWHCFLSHKVLTLLS